MASVDGVGKYKLTFLLERTQAYASYLSIALQELQVGDIIIRESL